MIDIGNNQYVFAGRTKPDSDSDVWAFQITLQESTTDETSTSGFSIVTIFPIIGALIILRLKKKND